jgi:hypothetical protein
MLEKIKDLYYSDELELEKYVKISVDVDNLAKQLS